MNNIQRAIQLAIAHVEENGWDDEGYYTEYHYDRNNNYGEDGNQVEDIEFGDEILFDKKNDVYYVNVCFTYGHGSKYNDGDWITDDENCWIRVDINDGSTEQVDVNEVDGINDFDDVTESLTEEV